jgi:vacuolar-type H+-ATPase subunit C/Vma6
LIQPPRYSRVLAKIGAGRGQLINEGKIASLAEMKTLSELAAQLRDTNYQHQISKVLLPFTSRKLERAFRENLIEIYVKIIENSPKNVKQFLSAYLFKIEVENIKTVLNVANTQLTPEQKIARIYLSVEDFLKHRDIVEEAVKAPNLKQAINAFKNLSYRSALNMGLKSFEETGSTACLDVFIDKSFYEKTHEIFDNLPRKEQSHAYSYVSLENDSFTLLTLLRGKALDYDPNWLRLAVPRRNFDISNDKVESLLAAVDFEATLKIVLETHYGKYFLKAQTPQDTIANAEKAFRKALFQFAKKHVVTENFNIGAPLSFMKQKEVEVFNLTALSVGIEAAMKPNDIRSQLLI